MVLAKTHHNLHIINGLTSFMLINDQGVDLGMPIRERAQRLLRFLRDDSSEPTSRSSRQEPRSQERHRPSPPQPPPRRETPPRADEPSWKNKVNWDEEDAEDARKVDSSHTPLPYPTPRIPLPYPTPLNPLPFYPPAPLNPLPF